VKKYNIAEEIHIELLSMESQNQVLRNWSYYELQQLIEYKVERVGIENVDPITPVSPVPSGG
jgi:transposase